MVYYFVFVRDLPRIEGASNVPAYFAALRGGQRPVYGVDTPKSARAIINACWDTEPKNRPSASELVDWWFDVEAASGACGFGGRVARQPGLPPLDQPGGRDKAPF